MEEKMSNIKHNLKVSQDRKKSYTDEGRIRRELCIGDHVFLKVKANRSSLKLGNYSKLEACYCGPLEILERIGTLDYVLALHAYMTIHNVFHVSLLKKYIPDANHVIDWNVIRVDSQEGAFQVHLVCILNQKSSSFRNLAIELVKVQWT
jgi:hypothetical protein